jgi:integrase
VATLLKRKSKKTGRWLWMVQVSLDRQGRRRPTITFRGLTKAQATTAKGCIESLAASKRAGISIDGPVADWLGTIGDDLYARLVEVGLCQPRQAAEPGPQQDVPTLAAFLDSYIAERDNVKPGTALVYRQVRRNLVDRFAGRRLDEITIGDADDWRRWLTRPKDQGGQGLNENTTRKRCAVAKQVFADAVDRELVDRNPFSKMKGLTVGASDGRDYFVSRAEAQAVLDACPDSQWRLIFALARFAGLRCPSEHLGLTWGDIDLDAGRMLVRSPKTERHEGKAERVVPIFPELRPYLQAARDELLADDFDPKVRPLSREPVISRYRDTNANLRTQLLRIIAKAKLTAWPKLFQNLRATRATELAAEHPAHVAAEWLGHSTAVADKHYWRVTDADFDRALRAANALQYSTVTGESDGNERKAGFQNPLDVRNSRYCTHVKVVREGFEPPTKGL